MCENEDLDMCMVRGREAWTWSGKGGADVHMQLGEGDVRVHTEWPGWAGGSDRDLCAKAS